MDYESAAAPGRRWLRRIEERIHLDFDWARRLAGRVRDEGIELVFSMSERAAVPLALWLPRRVKLVTVVNGLMGPKWLRLVRTLGIQQRFSHIATYSQAEADALVQALPIDPSHVSCLPGYVDEAFFLPSGTIAADSSPSFIMSQGLAKRDYPTLLRAMARLPEVPCQISAFSAWENSAADFGDMAMPANVRMVSHNHPSSIRQALESCRFLVIPLQGDTNFWTAGSTTALQAQAMGRPVIATRLKGLGDYVKDGVTGILVPPHDPEAMARAIAQLWNDPERAAAMGQAGRKWVNDRFRLQHWVERAQALLERQFAQA